jgi:hypothetical protein
VIRLRDSEPDDRDAVLALNVTATDPEGDTRKNAIYSPDLPEIPSTYQLERRRPPADTDA